jgi:hypothetical protein
MFSKPGIVLRTEGAAALVLAVLLYRNSGAGWGMFALFFLWPDLMMVGYFASPRIGAPLYNLAHTYVFPLALAAVSSLRHLHFAYWFSLIWLAHIGFDRLFGYGLKYPTFFKDTHLQRVS